MKKASTGAGPEGWALVQPTPELCRLFHGIDCRRGCIYAAPKPEPMLTLARAAFLEGELKNCQAMNSPLGDACVAKDLKYAILEASAIKLQEECHKRLLRIRELEGEKR